MSKKPKTFKPKTIPVNNRIVQICSCIAICLIGLFFTNLTYASIIQTCRIDPANPYSEIINFENDMVWVNLALIGLTILAALAFLRKKINISKVNTLFIVLIMMVMTTFISLKWIYTARSIASGDALTLLNTARDAAQDKYDSFFHSYAYYGNYSYYLFYPFQLGYVFFAEILYRIFGTEQTHILFQIPNVIALNFIYVGVVKITKKIFDRKSVTNLTAILLGVCLQPMFMTTFTYGLLLGLAFSVWSIYFIIRYMKEDKLRFAAVSVVLMAISVLLKYNNMIMMAAVCIALILHVIDKKKFLALAVAAIMVLSSIGLQQLVIYSYSVRSGAELNTQVSQTLYFYLGISDSGMAPGWYNGKAMETLRDSKMDVDKANRIAKRGIEERFDELLEEDPETKNMKLTEFYHKKLVSQLNEPSFESIWISEVRNHDYPEGAETPKLLDSVYTGGLHKVLDLWFNYYTMIIYLFFTAGMVWMVVKKKLQAEAIILPVTVLGGILYHLLFEGKSQYLLTYFILLIPFAAYGIVMSMRALNSKCDLLFRPSDKVDTADKAEESQ